MTRSIIEDEQIGSIWVEGKSKFKDSRTLLTISNSFGENSFVISPNEIVPSNAKLYVQSPPERVVPKHQEAKRRFAKFATYLGYALSTTLLTFVILSATEKIEARVVLTGSMSPAINSGDIIIVAPITTTPPKVGDVVTYKGRRFDGTEVASFTHRIISGDSQTGFLLKGDANKTPDTQRVLLDDIEGKVVFQIPFICQFLLPRALFALIPFIFIFWLLIDKFRNEQ